MFTSTVQHELKNMGLSFKDIQDCYDISSGYPRINKEWKALKRNLEKQLSDQKKIKENFLEIKNTYSGLDLHLSIENHRHDGFLGYTNSITSIDKAIQNTQEGLTWISKTLKINFKSMNDLHISIGQTHGIDEKIKNQINNNVLDALEIESFIEIDRTKKDAYQIYLLTNLWQQRTTYKIAINENAIFIKFLALCLDGNTIRLNAVRERCRKAGLTPSKIKRITGK